MASILSTLLLVCLAIQYNTNSNIESDNQGSRLHHQGDNFSFIQDQQLDFFPVLRAPTLVFFLVQEDLQQLYFSLLQEDPLL